MATMDLASTPRELPQFGRHMTSLARPASEVFGHQGTQKRCCGGQGLAQSSDWRNGYGLECRCANATASDWSTDDLVILDSWAVSVSQGLCCLPVEIELAAEESGRRPSAFEELVAQRSVSVKFKYAWVPWPKDSVCETEWWEAVAKGDDPPSGYIPKAESGFWNPSHTEEKHGISNRKSVEASQKRDLAEAKSDPFADDPENDDQRVLTLTDVPWGGAGGREVNILIRAKSDCGAACLLMRYRYDGTHIDIAIHDVSFDTHCGDGTLSGKKNEQKRPAYGSLIIDWKDWVLQIPRDNAKLRWSSPRISTFRGRAK